MGHPAQIGRATRRERAQMRAVLRILEQDESDSGTCTSGAGQHKCIGPSLGPGMIRLVLVQDDNVAKGKWGRVVHTSRFFVVWVVRKLVGWVIRTRFEPQVSHSKPTPGLSGAPG